MSGRLIPEKNDDLIRLMISFPTAAPVCKRNDAPLRALWENDERKLAYFYPSDSGDVYDRPRADFALCRQLAFWTGADASRIDRLFKRSALVREVWLDNSHYRDHMISASISLCTSAH